MKVPKKIRQWYRTYCSKKKEAGQHPYPLKIWAAMEFNRCEDSARGREIKRFLLGGKHVRVQSN